MNIVKPGTSFWMLKPLLLLLLVALLATACGKAGNQSRQNDAEEPPKPVTLTIMATLDPAILEKLELEKHLKAKYPHISLKFIQIKAPDLTFETALASGEKPDLVCCSIASVGQFIDLGLLSDMTPLIKKHQFDLTRLRPGMEATVRSYSQTGEFTTMPFYMSNNVVYYNKGIFDLFGLSYPKDGMTWSDVSELNKKLTRFHNGIQYYGFQFNQQNMTYKNQMALAFVDRKTNKAIVNTDQWAKWMRTMGEFSFVEGNKPGNGQNLFLKDQTLAMYTGPSLLTLLPDAMKNGLQWGIVSLPDFDGMKGAGTQMNAPYFAIPPTSEHKDEAFQFLSVLLSEEVQTNLAAIGSIPVIQSEKAEKALGSAYPELRDNNLQAFFKDTIAKPQPYTRYDSTAANLLFKQLEEYQKGNKDVNTALRDAEEIINTEIAKLVK
jgi:multiple sugar transport system substrate-binding protein